MAKPKHQSRWGRDIPGNVTAPRSVDEKPVQEQTPVRREPQGFFRGARIKPKN